MRDWSKRNAVMRGPPESGGSTTTALRIVVGIALLAFLVQSLQPLPDLPGDLLPASLDHQVVALIFEQHQLRIVGFRGVPFFRHGENRVTPGGDDQQWRLDLARTGQGQES